MKMQNFLLKNIWDVKHCRRGWKTKSKMHVLLRMSWQKVVRDPGPALHSLKTHYWKHYLWFLRVSSSLQDQSSSPDVYVCWSCMLKGNNCPTSSSNRFISSEAKERSLRQVTMSLMTTYTKIPQPYERRNTTFFKCLSRLKKTFGKWRRASKKVAVNQFC